MVAGPSGATVPIELYQGIDFPGADLPPPAASKRLRKRAYVANSAEDCMPFCVNYVPFPDVARGARCVAASYDGLPNGSCYLKHSIAAVNEAGGRFKAGKFASYTPAVRPVLISYPPGSNFPTSALPDGGTSAPPPPAAPSTSMAAASSMVVPEAAASSTITAILPEGDITTQVIIASSSSAASTIPAALTTV